VITSHHNPLLKDIRRLHRRRDGGRFVAEGEDLVAAADAAGWTPVVRLRAGVDVEADVLAKVSSLGSGTRELAGYEERWAQPAGPVCVALWGVKDPGNVGTVLRGARAFGAACVAIGPNTADPFATKAVRASMGAIFDVPVVRVSRVDELPGRKVALAAHTGRALSELEPGDLTLVIGAERDGLRADVVAECDEAAQIPILSDSLNAAMAATIGLYEVAGRVARA
jgi:RNA methyltransferase, TrmH family